MPSDAIDQLLADQPPTAGRRCELTVLLADIRDFTQLTETLSPEALVAFLNDYFARMVAIVTRNGGRVDKYMGDGLLAVFRGRDAAEHATRGAACALEMHFCLMRLNDDRSRQGLAPIRFGVAVNTGWAIEGVIGCAARQEYTVVGDVVNTVSRIESLNPRLGTELLATEATYALTNQLFAYNPIGRIEVRGRTAPVGVYQLLGPTTPSVSVAKRHEAAQGAVKATLKTLDLARVFDPRQVDAHVLRRA
jgi:adenylate cyclase